MKSTNRLRLLLLTGCLIAVMSAFGACLPEEDEEGGGCGDTGGEGTGLVASPMCMPPDCPDTPEGSAASTTQRTAQYSPNPKSDGPGGNAGPTGPKGGDPIYVMSGNVRLDEVDVVIPCPLIDLALHRSYNHQV